MTTIAIKDGIIAYDSRLCRGDTIIDENFDKCIEKDGMYFFICGTTADTQSFVDECVADGKASRKWECSAIMVDKEEAYNVTINMDTMYFQRCPIRKRHDAMGTGTDHALTAMDLGFTAAQAVSFASKRDINTNSKVRIHTIGE